MTYSYGIGDVVFGRIITRDDLIRSWFKQLKNTGVQKTPVFSSDGFIIGYETPYGIAR